ncbi:hypothetical protein MMC17_006075 [Xylographa soralifera]|nr:hypothetical protein [Xylographa soralifera]
MQSTLFHPIIPPALPPNANIALISPSSRLNTIFPTRITRTTAYFSSLGFTVREIFTPIPSSSSTSVHPTEQIAHRVAEIHQAFVDPTIHGIVCTIGGLSANELLPHIDYALIRSNPKPFCGYSDITLLHHAFYTKAGLRTFYGPAAIPQFGEHPHPFPFTAKHWLHVLQPTSPNDGANAIVGSMPRSETWTQEFQDWESEEDGKRPRAMTPTKGWKWLRPGTAEGTIMGGCLPSILQLAGTPYFPSYTDTILLLEMPDWDAPGVGMPLEFARSNVADLVNMGVIGEIRGMVIGRPYQYDEEVWANWEAMIVEMCAGTDFPILCNVDVGHTDPILTVPLGARCRLDSGKDEWVVLEKAVA